MERPRSIGNENKCLGTNVNSRWGRLSVVVNPNIRAERSSEDNPHTDATKKKNKDRLTTLVIVKDEYLFGTADERDTQ